MFMNVREDWIRTDITPFRTHWSMDAFDAHIITQERVGGERRGQCIQDALKLQTNTFNARACGVIVCCSRVLLFDAGYGTAKRWYRVDG